MVTAKAKAETKSGKTESAQGAENPWFQTQQKYWDDVFASARTTADEQMRQALSYQDQYASLFREWQSNLGGTGAKNAPGHDIFSKTMQSYLDMTKAFSLNSCADDGCEKAVNIWAEQMKSFFQGINLAGTSPSGFPGAEKMYADYAGKLQELMGMASPFGGFFAHAHKGLQSATTGLDPFGVFASMPALGYTREKQEGLQTLMNHWGRYERAVSIYNAALARIGIKALEKFQTYLNNPPEEALPLESVKAVFAKWIDISEEVYAEFAMTEEHTKIYGDVVNAMMAYRKQLNRITDSAVEDMNLPTRQEIDSLHSRTHELRRENRALRNEMEALKASSRGSVAPKKTTKGKKK